MNAPFFLWPAVLALNLIALTSPASGQGSKDDFERAAELHQRLRVQIPAKDLDTAWHSKGKALWYRKSLDQGKCKWVAYDIAIGNTTVAFDHEVFAKRLAERTKKRIDPDRLPIRVTSAFNEGFGFRVFDGDWTYSTDDGTLDLWSTGSRNDRRGQSPDRMWKATVRGHNVWLMPMDGNDDKAGEAIQLTADGTAEDGYRGRVYWSPDGKKLVVMKRQAGDERRVTIIDSTPDDQVQPKTDSYFYLKPGDRVAIDRPVLFDIDSKQEIELSYDLAENPFRTSGVRWKRDSSAFTYEYNQRGHQAYRVIEVDAESGKSRALISEAPKTFFTYSRLKFLHYLDDTNELIWMSERDGWNHLYLYDWVSGEVKRQLTKGQWVVREVDRVDEANRVVWLWAGGIHEGQDPYHLHYCRVDLDTGEVTPLTASDGMHTAVSVSPDGKSLVTTWSRVDHPPVHELRNAETGALIKEIARADASALTDAGWIAPERFAAKGRDGETDIYGIIIRPTNFDPNKKYPVIEQIYAGPHDAHVPKRFYGMHRNMQLAELGFIVVQIDGMGTLGRSKAFHDVAWKNLGDAGFPDRIAWMKAAAKTRPWMDLDRVGIYGGSAGGQNAMRAVLDHHDFYKAAAADCGCHDNRMDKIWWNEQWMGWPVDESYEKSSNVVDAHKLGGKLLLTVGELDKNVDPASTMQVVDALIKANKDFELMVFTGKGHGAGESRYGVRLRNDFFIRHLYGKTPRWE
jgi:dipeptidyl aminopeptidase/acylaminoacyl peptidase